MALISKSSFGFVLDHVETQVRSVWIKMIFYIEAKILKFSFELLTLIA